MSYNFNRLILGGSFPRFIHTSAHQVTLSDIDNLMKNPDLVTKGGKLIDVTYQF